MNRKTALSAAVISFFTATAFAATPEFEITIRNHEFEPAELTVPAGVKIKLVVHNEDATPEEFESYDLNREKVILGNSKGTVFIGPLKPGSYRYFGEFNPESAQGIIHAAEGTASP